MPDFLRLLGEVGGEMAVAEALSLGGGVAAALENIRRV